MAFIRQNKWLGFGIALIFGSVVIGLVLAIDASASDRPAPTTASGSSVDIGKRWLGDVDECVVEPAADDAPELPNCYREPVRRGSLIKQPWSAASALAFCVVGLVILAWADRDAFAADPPGWSRRLGWYGVVAVLMGPGAIAFHGTLTGWGGAIDQSSMYPLLAIIVSLDVVRLRRGPQGWWWSFALWFWGLCGLSVLAMWASGGSTLVFAAAGAGTGVFSAFSRFRAQEAQGIERSTAWYWVAVGALAVALVPWALSNAAVGNPTSGFPFHAAWHVLSAAFVCAYWIYLRSERLIPGASEVPAATV